MEFLHGGKETEDGGFVEVEVEGDLRDRHFRAILSEEQENAHSLAQRFAGTGFAVIGRERLWTTLRGGGQARASERAHGRKKNSPLMRKRGERESPYSHCETLFHSMKHQNPEEYNRRFCAIIGMRPPETLK